MATTYYYDWLQVQRGTAKPERVYVAVCEDGLRFWKTEGDFGSAFDAPLLSMPFETIASVGVEEDLLKVQHQGAEHTLRVVGEEGLAPWLEALQELAPQLLPEGYRAAAEGSGEEDEDEEEEEAEDASVGQRQTDVTDVTDRPSAQQSEPEPRLCEGLLLSAEATHFYVLTATALQRYDADSDARGAGSPPIELLVSSIAGYQGTRSGISLDLESSPEPLNLRAKSAEELAKWQAAFGEVLRARLGGKFEERQVSEKGTSSVSSIYPFSMDEPTAWQESIAENAGAWKQRSKGMYWSPAWHCKGCSASSKENPPSVMRAKIDGKDISICENCFAKAALVPDGFPQVFYKGWLGVLPTKGKEAMHLVILHAEELVMYKSPEMLHKKPDAPVMRHAIGTLDRFEVDAQAPTLAPRRTFSTLGRRKSSVPKPGGLLTLHFKDGTSLGLRTMQGAEDVANWRRAFESALGGGAPPNPPLATIPSAGSEAEQGPEASGERGSADEGGSVGEGKEEGGGGDGGAGSGGSDAGKEGGQESGSEGSEDGGAAAADSATDRAASLPAASPGAASPGAASPGVASPGVASSRAASPPGPPRAQEEEDPARVANAMLVKEGLMAVSHQGVPGVAEKTVRIFTNRIELWAADDAAASTGGLKQGSLLFADLSKLDIEDEVFVLHSANFAAWQLMATSPSEHDTWAEAFRVSGAIDAARSAAWPGARTRIEGPVTLRVDGEAAQAVHASIVGAVFAWSSGPGKEALGSVHARDLVEIDIHDQDGTLVINAAGRAAPLILGISEGSPAGLPDWIQAFEAAIEAQDEPAAPEPVALAPPEAWERKLRAIFDQCDPTASGGITVARLAEVCGQSALVASTVASMQVVGEGELRSVEDMLQALTVGVGGDRGREITWGEFLSLYMRTFAPALEEEVRLLHEGPLDVAHGDARQGVQHVRAYTTYIEFYEDAGAAARGTGVFGRVERADIQSLRTTERGFVLGLSYDQRLELRCVDGSDATAWRRALQLLSSPVARGEAAGGARPRPLRMGTIELQSSLQQNFSWEPPAKMAQEAAGAMVAAWVASLPSLPVKAGVLGVQDLGRILPRFCVLFEDRLEEWDQPLDAAHGRRPQRRIAAKDILGFETVGSGFILSLGSKKIGVRVRSNEDMHLWSQALLSVLAPGPKPTSWGLVQTAEFKSPAKARRPQKRKDRSIFEVLPPERHRPKEKVRKSDEAVRAALLEAHSAGQGLKFSTHRDGRQATELVYGKTAQLLRYAGQPGAEYVHSEVADKVGVPGDLQHPQQSLSLTEKVTGAYHALPARRRSVSPKITEAETATVLARRSKSVTGKVNAEGRRSVESSRRRGARRDPSRSAKTMDSAEGRQERLASRRAKATTFAPTGVKITDFGRGIVLYPPRAN